MEYRTYLGSVANLDAIADQATADAAVKAALGLVVSRLPERAAVEMAAALPAPLTFEKLRGHQAGADQFGVDHVLADLRQQFDLGEADARQVLGTVLALAREDLGPRRFEQVQRQLPAEWATLFEEAT
jgi:uncharacterized protein (DUF2267 family)